MKENIKNEVKLIGTITTRPCKAYIKNNIWVWKVIISVKRKSGVIDNVPVYLFNGDAFKLGEMVEVDGYIKTYNQNSYNGQRRLLVYVMANDVKKADSQTYCNHISFEGYAVSVKEIRRTPLGRWISEIIIAVNFENHSSYIPCIAWGANARFTQTIMPGDKVDVSGQFHSRVYNKSEENFVVEKTAYEISIDEIKFIYDHSEIDEILS